MKLTFNITKNNIKNGKQADPANCAIARAVKNNIKNKGLKLKRVSVLPNDITIKYFNEKTKRNRTISANMPNSGFQFIKAFDSGYKVQPFKLELNFK
jgi:hypothetical protein